MAERTYTGEQLVEAEAVARALEDRLFLYLTACSLWYFGTPPGTAFPSIDDYLPPNF